jgi:hypothetical protein
MNPAKEYVSEMMAGACRTTYILIKYRIGLDKQLEVQIVRHVPSLVIEINRGFTSNIFGEGGRDAVMDWPSRGARAATKMI